ncbi:hypothetical protein [Noviherbaspirillum saxi]|uniref:hypothetical protein n=1 Tax=Noviherbaspirillum saxi TaxID=2320863 RepID=UPI0011C44B06|nr:hypothetical protein [Noviherbaspirillum saxi]
MATVEKFIDQMSGRVKQDAKLSEALAALRKKCSQHTIVKNDSVMLFLVNALLGTQVAAGVPVQITDKAEKKEALHVISHLVKESMCSTAQPEVSWASVGTCLSRLRDLVVGHALDSDLQEETLTIIQNILSQMPTDPDNNKKRQKAIEKLLKWHADNVEILTEPVKNLAISITDWLGDKPSGK